MDGRAWLPNYWAPKGPRAPSIGQPHGREPRKANPGYRDTGMNLRTKTGGKPMYSERVDVKDVLGLVNAARQAAGWDALEDLPKGRRGPDRCPISKALNCGVDYYKAFMDRSYIINFSAAWESPVHILNAGLFSTQMPNLLRLFARQFDDGLFAEYLDPHGVDYEG